MRLPTIISNRFASASAVAMTPSTFYPEGSVCIAPLRTPLRILMCTVAGTTAASISSGITSAQIGVVSDDDILGTRGVYTSGSSQWVDVTGVFTTDWKYAAFDLGSIIDYKLGGAFNEYQTCLLSNDSRRVWVDCYATFNSNVSSIFQVGKEREDGTLIVSGTSTVVYSAIPHPFNYVDFISVDPESPTFERKIGATFSHANTNPNPQAAYWFGRGSYWGLIIELSRYAVTLGPTTNGDECFTSILLTQCSLSLDNSYIAPGALPSNGEPQYSRMCFSDSNLTLSGNSYISTSGYWVFDGGSINMNQETPMFIVSTGFTDMRFTGVAVHQIASATGLQIFSIRSTGSLHAAFDDCTGLTRAMLSLSGASSVYSYDIRVEGGELDGIYDSRRYLRLTNMYSLEKTHDVSALGGARDMFGSQYSHHVNSIANLSAGTKFALLDTLATSVTEGYYEVEVCFLVPEHYDLLPEDLWVDITFPSSKPLDVTVDNNNRDVQVSWVELELPPLADPPITGSTVATLATAIGFHEDDTPTRLWTNKTNTLNTTTSVATQIPTSTAVCEWLVLENFGFAIPPTANITGIEVVLYRYRSGGSTGNVRDSQIYLHTDYHGWGHDKAKTGTNWPTTTSSSSTYGGSTDTWGFWELLGEHVNDPAFSLRILLTGSSSTSNRVANIRYATVRVWYQSDAEEVPGREPEILSATSISFEYGGYTVPVGVGAAAIGGTTPDDDTYAVLPTGGDYPDRLTVTFPTYSVYRQSGVLKFRARVRADGLIGRMRGIQVDPPVALADNTVIISADWVTYEFTRDFGEPVQVENVNCVIYATGSKNSNVPVSGGENALTLSSSMVGGLQESTVDWIAPPGYKAVSYKTIGYAGDSGEIFAAIYLAYPNCDMYIDPFVRVTRLV